MSTYVSQLMQQTGIALPSATSWQGSDNLADIFSADSNAEKMPIQEQHQEVVVPQPIQSVSPLLQRLQASPAMEQTMPETPVENLSIGDTNVSDAPVATPTTTPLETPELTVGEQIEVQAAMENVSAPTPHQQQPRHNLEPPSETTTSPPSPLEVVEIRQAEPVKTQQAADPELTPQTYLQVVRDWVAGTPTVRAEVPAVEIDRPTPNQSDREVPIDRWRSPTVGITERESTPNHLDWPDPTQPIGVNPDRHSPLAWEQISHGEPQPPNLHQDLMLSIGSIHLTIAAPSPEITPPPPIVPPQAASAPEAEPFRLSRHYLRFR
jgi:hypothetical protein